MAEKWYAVSRENWRKFINLLIEIDEPEDNLSDKEIELWECYYTAKDHGKNEQGLLELPYDQWMTVMEAVGAIGKGANHG